MIMKLQSIFLLIVAVGALVAAPVARADCCDEYVPATGNTLVNARTRDRVYHVCPVCAKDNMCYYKEETRHGLEGCFDLLDGGTSGGFLSLFTGSYCCGNGGCNVFCCNCDGGCKGTNCPAATSNGEALLTQTSPAKSADRTAVAFFESLDANSDCAVNLAEFTAWFTRAAQNGTRGVEAEIYATFSDASLHANATQLTAYAAKAAMTLFATMDENVDHKIEGRELDFSLAHHKCKKKKTPAGRRLKSSYPSIYN